MKNILVSKNHKKLFSVALTAVASILLMITVLVVFSPYLFRINSTADQVFFAVLFALPIIPVGLYFGLRRKCDMPTLCIVLAVSAAALAIRAACVDNISGDYTHFLSDWVTELGNAPGVSRWKEDLGDYNMPYIYILTVISKLSFFPDMYLIKYASVLFDFVLAYYVMQCASLIIKKERLAIFFFLVVLLWPSSIMNSAFWAQCDATYTSMCLGAIYYALSKRPYLSSVFFALGFAFKLQTIFILPIIFVLLFTNRMKLKHLIAFPITFLATLVPALLAGKPFMDTISIYFEQTGRYTKLNLYSPSIFAFSNSKCDFEDFKLFGIMLAGACVVFLLYFAWTKREVLETKDIVIFAFLFSLAIPYFLPCMHERYFYPAEFFSLLLVFAKPKRWYISLLVLYSSFRACSIYMYGLHDVRLEYLSIIMLIVLGSTVYDLVSDLYYRKGVCCEN